MNKTIQDMRAEFARLHAENETLVNASATRELTADESERKTENFARMDDLVKLMEHADTRAAAAFQTGRVTMPSMGRDAVEYDRHQGILRPEHIYSTDVVRPLMRTEKFSTAFGGQDIGLGLGDYCRAMVCGARTNHEQFALAEGTDSTGGYLVPKALSAQVIDRLREGSVFVNAGAVTVPLNETAGSHKVARIGTDPSPAWKAENAAVAESEMEFEAVEFKPKTLAVIVRASRELLEDSLNVNQAIETAFAGAFAAELDRVCGWGTGSSDEPRGIVNTTGILSVNPVNTDGDELEDYSKFLRALYELRVNNATATGVVMSPREDLQINGFVDSTYQPLRRPVALESLPFHVSSKAPVNETAGGSSDASSIIMGDFSKLWIGLRNGLRVEVLRDGKYGANLQYAFLGYLRADVALTHVKAFARIKGIVPVASS